MSLPNLDNIDVIYLDMDGVLVDLNAGVSDLLDIDVAKAATHDKSFGLAWARRHSIDDVDYADDLVWRLIRASGSDFWEHLDWAAHGKLLFMAAARRKKTTILSSPADGGSAAGKMAWLRKHKRTIKALYGNTNDDYRKPPHRRFALSPSKEIYAHPRALLIDDHHKNINAFQKAGGHAVTWPQPWNSSEVTRGTIVRWLGEGNHELP